MKIINNNSGSKCMNIIDLYSIRRRSMSNTHTHKQLALENVGSISSAQVSCSRTQSLIAECPAEQILHADPTVCYFPNPFNYCCSLEYRRQLDEEPSKSHNFYQHSVVIKLFAKPKHEPYRRKCMAVTSIRIVILCCAVR